MRYVVIGDIGGHRAVLETLLERAGCVLSESRIAPGWTIVQLGDLVHRGPDSAGVVDLVDHFLTGRDKDRWVQLAGNHEAQYVRPGGPTFSWPEQLPAKTIETIQRWWTEGRLQIAAAANGALITHAGLTRGFWTHVGQPATAAKAASVLNALPRHRTSPLWTEGVMISGQPTLDAGPLWASSSAELVPSWLRQPPPFDQIVGHSALVDWETGQSWTDDQEVLTRCRLIPEHGMGFVEMDHRRFWCIDANHQAHPAQAYGAVVVDVDETIGPLE